MIAIRTDTNEKGFTLVEMMVVIAIIGILAAIAIPQYYLFKQRSYKSSLQNDARSIANVQEAYFSANNKYVDDFSDLIGSPFEVALSSHTTIDNWHASANTFSFTCKDVLHGNLEVKYISNRGGIQ